MAEKKTIVTYKGLKDIEGELQDLKVNKRREIAAKIKEAREQGDLSENAEYDAAKDEQRDIENRIEQLEAILKNVEVVDEDEVDTDTVGIGCTVKVFDYEFDEEIVYDIVGSTQADIMKNKISDESPVGMALKGAKVGSEVTVEAPDGEFKYRVLEIKRQEM
ncbi:transcription elongation factor GreA [Coprococcus sp. CAG:782]|jgi:transcription elongation factor GreA|uniref:transcription elongation factor GreA n=1 Tax=Coprococcus sp. OM04-5BH TaxID=2293093 RepID=UPI000337D081|nr:transcription elongation factor GreA [Coprococcus sp. OM04-5BH]RHV34539.1 transcription elongation factor GreA [Coprococcus sp. OM04-5BH]CCY52991.1 transcription elongation factor GreA [Coprococcus sp. CAG:782]